MEVIMAGIMVVEIPLLFIMKITITTIITTQGVLQILLPIIITTGIITGITPRQDLQQELLLRQSLPPVNQKVLHRQQGHLPVSQKHHRHQQKLQQANQNHLLQPDQVQRDHVPAVEAEGGNRIISRSGRIKI